LRETFERDEYKQSEKTVFHLIRRLEFKNNDIRDKFMQWPEIKNKFS